MADADAQRQAEEDQGLKLPPYPPPPPFYLKFTTENKHRLEEIKKEAGIDTSADNGKSSQLSAEQVLALPSELRYLIPPEPPADTEEFKVFGTVAQLNGRDTFSSTMDWISQTLAGDFTLTDWKYEQLYPCTDASANSTTSTLDRQRYLFRFLRSILLAYIELLGIVAVNPTADQKDDKLKDILTMVANMHALINEYRPHQARETLIRELERQVQRAKREIEGVKKMKERVEEVLEGFGREVPEEKVEYEYDEGIARSKEEKKREAQRQMWQAMDEMLSK